MNGTKVIALLFTAAIIFAGGLMVRHGGKVWLQAHASLDWIEAPAIVDHFEFKVIPGQRSESFAEMAYTFKVNGETYQGERICFGPATGKLLPEKASSGKKITINYDPSNPSNCVWRKGHTGRNQGLVIAGLITTFLGLAAFIAIIRSAFS